MLEFVNIEFRAVISSWVDLNLKPLMSLIFSFCDNFCQFSSSSFVILKVTTRWRVFVFIILVNVKGVTVHPPHSWCCLCEFCEFVYLLKFISNPQISTLEHFPGFPRCGRSARDFDSPDMTCACLSALQTAPLCPLLPALLLLSRVRLTVCLVLRQHFCTFCWWCQYLKWPPSVI